MLVTRMSWNQEGILNTASSRKSLGFIGWCNISCMDKFVYMDKKYTNKQKPLILPMSFIFKMPSVTLTWKKGLSCLIPILGVIPVIYSLTLQNGQWILCNARAIPGPIFKLKNIFKIFFCIWKGCCQSILKDFQWSLRNMKSLGTGGIRGMASI